MEKAECAAQEPLHLVSQTILWWKVKFQTHMFCHCKSEAAYCHFYILVCVPTVWLNYFFLNYWKTNLFTVLRTFVKTHQKKGKKAMFIKNNIGSF